MHRQLNENEKYVETFESFYLTADQKQIAIVGKRYHYVFNAPAEVLNALTSDLHPIMDAAFLGFSVAVDQTITGTYKIYIDTRYRELNAAQTEKLKQLGFLYNGGWSLTGSLQGIRYEPTSNFALDGNSTHLNKTHSVLIEELPTQGEKTRRKLLSPIAKVADGVVTIASIPLIPIFILVAAGSCPACR